MHSLKKYSFILYVLLISTLFTQKTLASKCDGKNLDLKLALAIDISGSINDEEMQLQMEGYESAFSSKEVKDKFLNCSCVELSVIFWATKAKLVYGPLVVDDEKKLSDLASFFREESKKAEEIHRSRAEADIARFQGPKSSRSNGTTQMSKAIKFAREHLLTPPTKANDMSIIISGDGLISNSSSIDVIENLRFQRDFTDRKGISISGITIDSNDAIRNILVHNNKADPSVTKRASSSYRDLRDFYEQEVITPYSFVEPATSFLSFGAAVEKTLNRETCKLVM